MRIQQTIRTMVLALLLMAAGQGMARVISVHSAADVNNSVWQAGDTLVWTNGTYNGKKLTLQGTGTASAPIVLRAQTHGQVVLTTSSNLTFDGSYIEVHGFVFSGTHTSTEHVVQFTSNSSHCRITECAIEAYNPTDVTKDYKWVSLKGRENRVDHCYFEGKNNMGTLLVVWLENGIIPKHRIDHNYFGARAANVDSDGKALNGQEIMRIGDSGTSMQEAQCIVERNYFEYCDGEIEMISNKSCGNIYRENTFYACAGTLTFRHGNGCTAESNRFFGGGKNASGGVRIIGENHTVTNNYFQDLTGNNFRAALCIVRGKPNSALNEYFQVKDATVSGNIFVNCTEAVCVNYHSSSECTLPAVNIIIENNIVYNDAEHKNNRIVTLARTGGSVSWSGNTYSAGKWSNYTPSDEEWSLDADMERPEPQEEAIERIETQLDDGTWGEISSTAYTSGAYPSGTINGFELSAAGLQTGTVTCPATGERFTNRISVDKNTNGGMITCPTVSSCDSLIVYASAGSADRKCKLQYYDNTAKTWEDIVTWTFAEKGVCYRIAVAVNSEKAVKLRIANADGSTKYIWKIQTTPYGDDDPSVPTEEAFTTVSSEVRAKKHLRNGQLLLEINGRYYTAAGQLIYRN